MYHKSIARVELIIHIPEKTKVIVASTDKHSTEMKNEQTLYYIS